MFEQGNVFFAKVHLCPSKLSICPENTRTARKLICGVQITYILGATGNSYVVGYGCNPPKNPHHRDSTLTMGESGSWNVWKSRKVNANELTGAMVGGPDNKDNYKDDREDYIRNEVTIDYNAAMLLGVVQVSR